MGLLLCGAITIAVVAYVVVDHLCRELERDEQPGTRKEHDMVDPRVVLITLIVALLYYAGEEAAAGLKKLGEFEKKAVHTIAHVLKKIPHPHHEDEADK